MVKFLNYVLDFLMFVVPILDMTEAIAVIPNEYLPYYMLGTVVVLRRSVRVFEEWMKSKNWSDN